MSGFNTRVKLLEKWAPNLLPQLKDIDDLADIILDVWNEAEADTEQRIIKLLDEAKTYQQLERAIALIKGESAKGSVEPAQLEVLIKGEQE